MYVDSRMTGTGNNRLRTLADLMLLTVTLFWGMSFPVIKDTLDSVGVSTLVFLRFALAVIALLPVALVRRNGFRREALLPGLICGAFLFAAFLFQAVGLQYTTASRSGFITGLNVVLVPLFTMLLFRKMPGKAALAGVLLAFGGLYFLTSADRSSGVPFNQGDVWTICCAVFIAGHILFVGRYAPGRDHFWLTFIQFVVVAGGGAVWAGISGEMTLSLPWAAYGKIAFLAVLCTVYAFWTQTWAQQHTTPTRTALIFTMEPVFAAVFAWLWLQETMGLWGWAGAAMILAGILLAEIKPQGWNIRTESPQT